MTIQERIETLAKINANLASLACKGDYKPMELFPEYLKNTEKEYDKHLQEFGLSQDIEFLKNETRLAMEAFEVFQDLINYKERTK